MLIIVIYYGVFIINWLECQIHGLEDLYKDNETSFLDTFKHLGGYFFVKMYGKLVLLGNRHSQISLLLDLGIRGFIEFFADHLFHLWGVIICAQEHQPNIAQSLIAQSSTLANVDTKFEY